MNTYRCVTESLCCTPGADPALQINSTPIFKIFFKINKNCKTKRRGWWDFPGGPEVKNPPCSGGDTGLIPGLGTKISHAVEELSLHATTTELLGHN